MSKEKWKSTVLIVLILTLEIILCMIFPMEMVSTGETNAIQHIAFLTHELVLPFTYFTLGMLITALLCISLKVSSISRSWLRTLLRVAFGVSIIFVVFVVLTMWIPMPHVLPDLLVMRTYVSFRKIVDTMPLLVVFYGAIAYLLCKPPHVR